MNETKTFKDKAKDWWNNNKRVIKAGLVCGTIAFVYGLYTGHVGNDNMWHRYGFERKYNENDYPCDEYGLNELNCDDPELLELVKFENENA